jgi:hypothetical protein
MIFVNLMGLDIRSCSSDLYLCGCRLLVELPHVLMRDQSEAPAFAINISSKL